MKQITTREQLLKALHIKDFRHMKVQNVLKLISLYDRIDPEVAKAIIAQIPNFTECMKASLNNCGERIDKILKSNDEHSVKTCEILERRMSALEKELEREDTGIEYRMFIFQELKNVTDEAHQLEKENKAFLKDMAKYVFGTVAVVAGTVIVLAGGQLIKGGIPLMTSSSSRAKKEEVDNEEDIEDEEE